MSNCTNEGRLYSTDLAEQRGISVQSARALLAKMERRWGHDVVGRDGKARYTTKAALARITPEAVVKDQKLESRVRLLEEDLDATRGQLRAMHEEIRQLRDLIDAQPAGRSGWTGGG